MESLAFAWWLTNYVTAYWSLGQDQCALVLHHNFELILTLVIGTCFCLYRTKLGVMWRHLVVILYLEELKVFLSIQRNSLPTVGHL